MTYATEQSVLNSMWNSALEACITEGERRSPHVLMRPRVFKDGDKWCALYGDNLMVGVAGFGDSPSLACRDFDKLWVEG